MKKDKTLTKGEKIRLYKSAGNGQWTHYRKILTDNEIDLLNFALEKKYVTFNNDAPRGGKLGDYFKILKNFTFEKIDKIRIRDAKKRNKALSRVLKSAVIKTFSTISDVGSIKIDGACYSNFYGDGENTVEVCECNFNEFKTAKILTRRQAFCPKFPITILKFDAPKTIEVSRYDCNDNFGSERIDNACGFVIWERKIKIFVNRLN